MVTITLTCRPVLLCEAPCLLRPLSHRPPCLVGLPATLAHAAIPPRGIENARIHHTRTAAASPAAPSHHRRSNPSFQPFQNILRAGNRKDGYQMPGADYYIEVTNFIRL